MTENGKNLRIAAGMLLIAAYVLNVSSDIISRVMNARAFSVQASSNIRQLVSMIPSAFAMVLLLLTGIFVLLKKFTAAGIVTAISAVISMIAAMISLISFILLGRNNGNIFLILNAVFGLIAAIGTVLLAVALFIRKNTGYKFCLLSAIIGIAASIFGTLFMQLVPLGYGFDGKAIMVSVTSAMLVSMVPFALMFVAKVLLGKYFAGNPEA